MRLTVNGLDVHASDQGRGAPLVLLHGFTGSAAAWGGCLSQLAEHYRVIAVDLVGHGETAAPAALDHYRMPAVVADLAALLDALDLPTFALLGYSMGGRAALHFAAAFPERVRALLLESASPGIADPAERRARVAGDEALAERIMRDGLDAFVAEWEHLPLFRSQERLPAAVRAAHHAQRLHNRPLGLANSLRGMGTGAQAPLWDRLGEVTAPTLLVVGALDEKFRAINAAMQAALPDARLAVVPGAGHTVHLEQPEEFDRLVSRFGRST